MFPSEPGKTECRVIVWPLVLCLPRGGQFEPRSLLGGRTIEHSTVSHPRTCVPDSRGGLCVLLGIKLAEYTSACVHGPRLWLGILFAYPSAMDLRCHHQRLYSPYIITLVMTWPTKTSWDVARSGSRFGCLCKPVECEPWSLAVSTCPTRTLVHIWVLDGRRDRRMPSCVKYCPPWFT